MAAAVLPFPHQMAWVLSHLSGLDIDICPSHLTELGERTIGDCHISVYQRTNSTGKGIALFTDDVWCVQTSNLYGEIHQGANHYAVRCFVNGRWEEYVIEVYDLPSEPLAILRQIMMRVTLGTGYTPYRQLAKHTWLGSDRDVLFHDGHRLTNEVISSILGEIPDNFTDEQLMTLALAL